MAEKVTLEFLHSLIKDIDYFYHGTLTIAVATLKSGFKIVGTSACINPEDYDADLGRKLAGEDCVRQMWRLEAYCRMDMDYHGD